MSGYLKNDTDLLNSFDFSDLYDSKLSRVMKSRAPLLGPPLGSVSPEDFRAYVTSMYSASSTNPSSVREVSITFGDRIVVRCKRNPKYITEKELKTLASDYGKDVTEMRALFEKRKIPIRP